MFHQLISLFAIVSLIRESAFLRDNEFLRGIEEERERRRAPVFTVALAAQVVLLLQHNLSDFSAVLPQSIDDDESGLGILGAVMRDLQRVPLPFGPYRDALAQSALLEAGLVGFGSLSEFHPLEYVWNLLGHKADGQVSTIQEIGDEIEAHITELEGMFANPEFRARWAALITELDRLKELEPRAIKQIVDNAGHDEPDVHLDFTLVRLWLKHKLDSLSAGG
jgi:hypothetical protein